MFFCAKPFHTLFPLEERVRASNLQKAAELMILKLSSLIAMLLQPLLTEIAMSIITVDQRLVNKQWLCFNIINRHKILYSRKLVADVIFGSTLLLNFNHQHFSYPSEKRTTQS